MVLYRYYWNNYFYNFFQNFVCVTLSSRILRYVSLLPFPSFIFPVFSPYNSTSRAGVSILYPLFLLLVQTLNFYRNCVAPQPDTVYITPRPNLSWIVGLPTYPHDTGLMCHERNLFDSLALIFIYPPLPVHLSFFLSFLFFLLYWWLSHVSLV